MTHAGPPSQPPTEPGTRASSVEAFWTLFVALPAALSILRLWVESGGQLQTTLLLVGNVGATDLVAAMFVTGTPLVTAGLVAVVSIGTVLDVSADHAPPDSRLATARPLFARLARSMPWWVIAATFVLAVATWKILYLPLLVPALVATLQRGPWRTPADTFQRWARRGGILAGVAAYGWLVAPTVEDAVRQREYMGAVLLTVPVLLAPLVAGPVPAWLARLLAVVSPPVLAVLLVAAAAPVLSTPVLPLSITVTKPTPDGEPEEYIRGHIITTTDVNLVILQEKGGVRYVPNDAVLSQVLCDTEDELPRYRLWVHDFHVEDSLLKGLGRRVRPVTTTDAACRAAPGTL